ncbi:hypothetical protein [Cohnella terricola]|uniref:Uncharacterized protein n=1 Tax=Cohnella terricola TaxID=1289167 RepID=A0A559JX65_9BACL|nr:hypothetical protein [Cohnella terricola]TVY04469.1 hypothetical protein FPZ45_02495 [Cohnella terricola]
MTASITLAIYLFIGLLYAHHKYKELVNEFHEDIDENDPEEKEYLQARNNLYDQLYNLHNILGEKRLKAVLYLMYMIFWFPMIVYMKVNALRR